MAAIPDALSPDSDLPPDRRVRRGAPRPPSPSLRRRPRRLLAEQPLSRSGGLRSRRRIPAQYVPVAEGRLSAPARPRDRRPLRPRDLVSIRHHVPGDLDGARLMLYITKYFL